jgi:hypothetical protein
MEVGGNRNPDAILVSDTRLMHLVNKFQTLLDKVDTGTQRQRTATTGRRGSSTSILPRRRDKVQANIIRRRARQVRRWFTVKMNTRSFFHIQEGRIKRSKRFVCITVKRHNIGNAE